MKLPSTMVLVLALAAVPPAIAQAPAPTAKPSSPPPATSQRLDGIAAVVNNEAVLQSDVEEQLYLFLMRSQTQVDSATVDTLRTQILNQLIDEKLILAEAQRLGITVSDAEVNRQAQEALADTKSRFDTPAAYQDQLRKENMNEEQLLEKLRGEARRQALVSRLMNKQVPHRTLGQLEAETYFKIHKDKFPHAPAELRLSVIQIPAQPESLADAKAKARAVAIRARIVSGEKFAKVAAEASDDETSARSGGDLGYLVRGSMDPAFEKAVFTRKLNTVDAPVRTIYGWHVIEVLDRDTLKTKAGRDTLGQDKQPLLEAHVRHVLVRVPLTDADVERTRKLAESVRAQAVAGKPFAELAKQYNRYAGPHSDDGDIGFLPLTSLQANIRSGLDTVQVGGVSQVLVNQAGFNIFRVTERKADREYALDEIKGELPQVVSEMIFREKLDEWVKGLRAKAHIQINKS